VRFLGAFCVLFLRGCGLTSSPADSLTFHAPYGWRASPGILGYVQFWYAPAGDQALILIRSPKMVDLSRSVSQADFERSSSSTNVRWHVDSFDRVTVCGNQPAIYMIGEAYKDTKNGQVEDDARMVMSNVNGATYIAAYTYPQTGEPNGEALAALRQLCLKK
jgi:hypothetical protein